MWDTDDAGLGRFEGAAADAVHDASHAGLGISFEGVAAIRSFVAEWWETFEDQQTEVLEVVALGQGVAFARVREVGRPVDSDGHVEQFRGWVILGMGGKIERVEPTSTPPRPLLPRNALPTRGSMADERTNPRSGRDYAAAVGGYESR